MLKDLEKELRKWREKRAKTPPSPRFQSPGARPAADRRTVRVNGQEVVVVKKSRRSVP